MVSASLSCKKCNLAFDSMREINQHNFMVHLKEVMINTDIGSTLTLSKIDNGKFICSKCFRVFSNFDEIILHSFCEIIDKTVENIFFASNSKRKINDVDISNQPDLETEDNYEFIFTNLNQGNEYYEEIEISNFSYFVKPAISPVTSVIKNNVDPMDYGMHLPDVNHHSSTSCNLMDSKFQFLHRKLSEIIYHCI